MSGPVLGDDHVGTLFSAVNVTKRFTVLVLVFRCSYSFRFTFCSLRTANEYDGGWAQPAASLPAAGFLSVTCSQCLSILFLLAKVKLVTCRPSPLGERSAPRRRSRARAHALGHEPNELA